MSRLTDTTAQVYYDRSDPGAVGWAWRAADPMAGSGPLDSDLDGEPTLTADEAWQLAALALCEDSAATYVAVYWHGDRDPIIVAREAIPFGVGAEVEAGDIPEDHDAGRVTAVLAHGTVEVAWSNGERTLCPSSRLREA